MMNKLHYLFHSIAYYVAWFSCIALAARGFSWMSSLIVFACVLIQIYWQYRVQHNTRGLWSLLGLIVCMIAYSFIMASLFLEPIHFRRILPPLG